MLARHVHRDVRAFDKDGECRWAVPADCDDWGDQCIAELIYAVETLAGELPGTASESRAEISDATQALSPQHLAYRALLAEVADWNPESEEPEDQKADEQAFAALLDRVSDAEKAIWATPATTLADLLLRAEIAENNENGVMGDLDNPDAYLDDRAFAQLIRAALDVLGGRHAL